MKLCIFLFAAAASLAGAVMADQPAVAPSSDVSPMEKHPECMDRTAAAAGPQCEIQDQGLPHHLHPPKPPIKSKTVAPAPAKPPAGKTAAPTGDK